MRIMIGRDWTGLRRNLSWLAGGCFLTAVVAYYAETRGSPSAGGKSFVAMILAVLAFKYRRHIGFMTGMVLVLAVFDRKINFLRFTADADYVALVVAALPFALAWRPKAMPRTAVLAIGLIAAGALLADATGPSPKVALSGTLQWLLVLNAIIGIVGHISDHPEYADKLANVFMWCGIISGGLEYMQKHGHYILVRPAYDSTHPNSSFGYYSNFGNFEAMVTVVSLGVLLSGRRSKRTKALALVAVLVASLMTVGNLSRGALVSLGVGAAVLLVLAVRRPGRLLLAVAALGVLYAIQPSNIIGQLRTRFDTIQGGDAERYQLQGAGRSLLNQRPFGVGFGNFATYVQNGIVDVARALVHSHSLYVQTGLDTGYMGLAGLILLLAAAVLRGLRSNGFLPIGAIAAAAVIGEAVQGYNDFFFFEIGSHVVFAIPIAIALASPRRVGRPKRQPYVRPTRETMLPTGRRREAATAPS